MGQPAADRRQVRLAALLDQRSLDLLVHLWNPIMMIHNPKYSIVQYIIFDSTALQYSIDYTKVYHIMI